MDLIQMGLAQMAPTVAWWPNEAAGWIGAIGGSVLGLIGAGIGVAAATLAPRGRGRKAVMGVMIAAIVAGAGLLIAGIVAVSLGQPYAVWYPLVLTGFIATTVMGSLLPVVRVRYREAEQRRVDAAQLRRL